MTPAGPSISEDWAHDIAASALSATATDEAEAVIVAQDTSLTRFASNHIHQNVRERDAELWIRVVVDQRVGSAMTNDLSSASVASTARRAVELAGFQPRRPDWPGLPGPEPISASAPADEPTVAADPEVRAQGVAPLCAAAQAAGADASGAFSTGSEVLAVANTHGVWAYHAGSRASWIAVVMADSGAGYSQRTGRRIADLDTGALGREALDTALAARDPGDVEPGTYPVVLSPYAAGTLVGYLGALGFSGSAIAEGRSFMSEQAGQRVAADSVTIVDNWRHPMTVPAPFDYEGVPRQRVECLTNGIAAHGVWDRASAARAGGTQRSTGHALPAHAGMGPYPLHLVLNPGTDDDADLLARVEDGLYVTRFNYVRAVMPKQTVITGLTRDGTFRIRNGRLGPPVKNLRFTQSILEALEGVLAIGRSPITIGDWGATVVPAMALSGFRFTGATTY